MILQSLSLINYKNFESINLEFDPQINCMVGQNGVGKTNILDAIYHLSFGKSYFNPITSQNIRHDADFFVIDALYKRNERDEKVLISAQKGQKKIIKRNGKSYDTLSEHIGFLPLVIISPADRDLITEGSTMRRKFIDGVISQSNPSYLHNLISYNKVLSQRNSLLKYFAANQTFDNNTLSIYNEQLQDYGSPIYDERNRFLHDFIPVFKERYNAITSGHEIINLKYQSKLSEAPLAQLLEQSLSKDRALQYTSTGIHKDDLSFELSGYPIKKFGSQGQQKSFLIALKLAQFECLKKESNIAPILLLDDIFDKLDEQRVAHIVKLVADNNFGQLFISDTHNERTEQVVKNISQSYKMFPLGNQ